MKLRTSVTVTEIQRRAFFRLRSHSWLQKIAEETPNPLAYAVHISIAKLDT